MKIVIGINSLTSADYAAYSNHIQVFYRLGHWASEGKHQVVLVNPARCAIDRMRNMAAKVALEVDADYLLFIDDDVIVPTNFFTKIFESGADIVAGDVIIRGYPFDHMSFVGDKFALKAIPDLKAEVEKQGIGPIINVGAVGFSLCLIKTEVLRRTPQPWFITGISNTEDIYFCLKAKEANPDLTIKLDTRIECGHILWSEVMSRSSKEAYTAFMESQNPQLLESTKASPDRGDDYLKRVKGMENVKA